MKKEYPQVAYGAVYFRKSNPPKNDWERDYVQAAQDGMNMFRHWFMWGAIEVAPGVFDWSEYDKQLDLAAQNGIGTIVAEFAESVPEWFFYEHKHLFTENRTGVQAPYTHLSGSCESGGFVPGGLCLDNPDTRLYVERFLRALAERYKGHPGLFGYDIWNECNYSPNTCFCECTQQKFRLWLQKKYGTLKKLGEAWHRYSYSEWEQVQAPRFVGQNVECLDWLTFRKENYYQLYKWKVDIIRSVDPDAHITAHGVAASLDYTYGDGNDDWMAAAQVESYGMTWVMGRKGTEPWKQWQAVDLVRAASRGKIFWHAEMQGGPLWLQPQVVGREKEDGRVTTADDVRLWNLVSLAGGARGVLYLRWRSLLDGQLFGSFGLYSNDGLPNDRSRAASKIAKWANSAGTKGLFAAQPVKAGIGIIVLDQIQEFSRLLIQAGEGKFYAKCQWGAYQAFFDSKVQVDWVHFDDIDQYKVLYFAYPLQLDSAKAAKLSAWVRGGGRLICEGLPGYFGDNCSVGTKQPNSGLDELFGAVEQTVEFMPDLGDRIRFHMLGVDDIPGGLFRQSYQVVDGEALGTYPDNETSSVCKRYGDGMAILLGTYPSEGYFRAASVQMRALISKLLDLTEAQIPVRTESGNIQARLTEDGNNRYLWLINHNSSAEQARVRVTDATGISQIFWGDVSAAQWVDGGIDVCVPGKDAVILQLD